jgi:hypothetical protein
VSSTHDGQELQDLTSERLRASTRENRLNRCPKVTRIVGNTQSKMQEHCLGRSARLKAHGLGCSVGEARPLLVAL